MRFWLFFPLLIGMLGISMSCSDDASCSTDTDCFSGEYCSRSGTCVQGPRPKTEGEMNVSDMVPDMSDDDDARRVESDGSFIPDVSATPDMSENPDVNQGGSDGGPTPACVVDPFSMCVDEENDNNEWPGESVTSMTRGCPNDFVPLDMTIDAKICQREHADIYGFTFYECDTSFVIEAILTPKTECDPTLFRFDVSGYPGRCGGDNPNLECEILSDGRHRIRMIVPGDPNGGGTGIYFYVESDEERNDIAFDYELQLTVRR